ncbi:ACP S-malonyltransferase [Thermobaculum terrenum]|nr:ACP S-malonyltransferase [Thermobaculum terrenum]
MKLLDPAVIGTIIGMSSRRIALVFPGQGSQYVGMGKALHDASEAAREVFKRADEILGFRLSHLCFSGPEEDLQDTINAQPAIFTVSLATLAAIKEKLHEAGVKLNPSFVAGHSLGEYTALVAANVIDFEDGLRLVRERGRLMKEEGEKIPGGMAAVIGLDEEVIQRACEEASSEGIVGIANSNSPGQIVISGELKALHRAMELLQQQGAKKVIKLPISIASHSPVMQRAAAQFAEIVSHMKLRDPQIPIVANVTGQILTNVEDIRRELSHHITGPVQWTKSIREMLSHGTNGFIELGPKRVLTGLIQRISPGVDTISTDS